MEACGAGGCSGAPRRHVWQRALGAGGARAQSASPLGVRRRSREQKSRVAHHLSAHDSTLHARAKLACANGPFACKMHAGRLHRSTAALPTRPACGLVTERGVPSDQRVLRRGVASSAGGDGAEGQGEGQVEAQGGAADAGRDRCARALPHEPARRRHEDDAARNAHTPAHPPRLARARPPRPTSTRAVRAQKFCDATRPCDSTQINRYAGAENSRNWPLHSGPRAE